MCNMQRVARNNVFILLLISAFIIMFYHQNKQIHVGIFTKESNTAFASNHLDNQKCVG